MTQPCKQCEKVGGGRVDPSDGHFYCTPCWDAYNKQQHKQKRKKEIRAKVKQEDRKLIEKAVREKWLEKQQAERDRLHNNNINSDGTADGKFRQGPKRDKDRPNLPLQNQGR